MTFDDFEEAIRALRNEGSSIFEEVLMEMKSFWRHGSPKFVKKMCYISSLNITLQPYNALDFPQYINLCHKCQHNTTYNRLPRLHSHKCSSMQFVFTKEKPLFKGIAHPPAQSVTSQNLRVYVEHKKLEMSHSNRHELAAQVISRVRHEQRPEVLL